MLCLKKKIYEYTIMYKKTIKINSTKLIEKDIGKIFQVTVYNCVFFFFYIYTYSQEQQREYNLFCALRMILQNKIYELK